MKTRGDEHVKDVQTYIATELNARHRNPKWIREMQKAGYSGARDIAKNMGNLYGLAGHKPEHMDRTFWQNSYDPYVADKYGLGMKKFFDQANPQAMQTMLAAMLEVDRQGSYKFSARDRGEMVDADWAGFPVPLGERSGEENCVRFAIRILSSRNR
jgi:cobaltochelatase CobN